MFYYPWLPAPQNLVLSSDDVHIWRINLNQSESQLQFFRDTLSSDEIARAERFYFPEHRRRFIVGRGSLRTILGRYLGVEASEIKFIYQKRGKPLLANSGLFFNLSHSQDLALLGVSYKGLIGVDLEYIRLMSDLEGLAKRFFLPKEYELIKLLSFEEQQQVFFRYWTCKEAYLKATGDGLVELEQIEVFLKVNEPAKLLVSGDWCLRELIPSENFASAVVVQGNIENWQCWEY
ncbi:4'-phosphopantetheinyl transferase HetI [Cronbergia sp. UHCC 0137]|uniref:4'-phosphopantetheinyl transferase HetI n=1 Tax=Cronbergia sp. UHCC 0137 TaxID=3110239 RepID=UPI002B20BF6A|nr:4'-phosphopantetheinyl transferase HetI [Cronbergia sp. UHCC 0137]MEA5617302.1 4'-phosphopantetheinyl transferase HetI [Cronbergia sp. UHCC 0137]